MSFLRILTNFLVSTYPTYNSCNSLIIVLVYGRPHGIHTNTYAYPPPQCNKNNVTWKYTFNVVYIGIFHFLYVYILYHTKNMRSTWIFKCAHTPQKHYFINWMVDIKWAMFILFCTAVCMEHFQLLAIYRFKKKAVNLFSTFANIYKLYELKVLRHDEFVCISFYICVCFLHTLYSSSGFSYIF